jgi:hypothetical protein
MVTVSCPKPMRFTGRQSSGGVGKLQRGRAARRLAPPALDQSMTATASISIRAPGMARPATCTKVLAGGVAPKNSWRTSP